MLVRPDMMKDQVVELELAEVQKKFNVSGSGHKHCLVKPEGGARVLFMQGTPGLVVQGQAQAARECFCWCSVPHSAHAWRKRLVLELATTNCCSGQWLQCASQVAPCGLVAELCKRVCALQPGDHVRVLNGPHAGERGMVVNVEGPQCVLLPDTRQAELKVFVRDLTEAKESGTGALAH